MVKKYFGTDGIRGQVGQYPISADFMLKLGWAAGKVFSQQCGKKVIIGKDTRISGYMFESALEAGLVAAGCDVVLLGPMPTPAIAYLTRTLRACAGIVISASHNPHHDNGIKFFSAEGTKLSDELELAIEAELENEIDTVDSEQLGKVTKIDAEGRYIEYCKHSVMSPLHLRGMKIVLDCANGATYKVGPSVFEEMGAEVISLGVDPDGLNINVDCGSTKPQILADKVKEAGADIGIAFDGDGDRVIMIDENGEEVDGDELVFIIADAKHKKGELKGPVVGTLMSNFGMEKALNELGIQFRRANVGDRYVLELMQNEGGIIGGESSGHIICLERSTTGDGIVAALQVLEVMVATGTPLKDLKNGMSKYPQQMINVKGADKTRLGTSQVIADAVAKAEAEMADTGRVLLRPSGTEDKVRVMVEGSDEAQVKKLVEFLADVVREELVS
ncbi:MAG: phosphoglucosamine mutase [Gammaproteobacteria bacterium]|nr:MAG: phosphoglucosamine mutase [Gammaproteobacteria bacterium]